MGGIGSGRHWHYEAKNTTGDLRAIDIRRWKRDGLLKAPNAFGWKWNRDGQVAATINVGVADDRVVLDYRHRRGERPWEPARYSVYLDWTKCHLGGKRPWFLCPASGCGRRVAILYGGKIFACRRCHQLAYASQRESEIDRATRRAEKVRERLNWPPGILNGNWPKPKGMHWRTFWRLQAEHDRDVGAVMDRMRCLLGGAGESLKDWL